MLIVEGSPFTICISHEQALQREIPFNLVALNQSLPNQMDAGTLFIGIIVEPTYLFCLLCTGTDFEPFDIPDGRIIPASQAGNFCLPITINDDLIVENNETLTFALSSDDDSVVIPTAMSRFILTTTDNDGNNVVY